MQLVVFAGLHFDGQQGAVVELRDEVDFAAIRIGAGMGESGR